MRAVVLLCLLVTACASSLPEGLRESPPVEISIAQARADIGVYASQQVRWGGRITNVENRAGETVLDIVAYDLDGSGRPREGDASLGRFLAHHDGFLDPAVYAKGREVTVGGTILGMQTRPIGQYAYPYVAVKADDIHLWPPPVERRPYDHYGMYDPFFSPFGPWWYLPPSQRPFW
jgi:outer membrane lipoprotein